MQVLLQSELPQRSTIHSYTGIEVPKHDVRVMRQKFHFNLCNGKQRIQVTHLGLVTALSALTTDQHDLAKMLLIPHKLIRIIPGHLVRDGGEQAPESRALRVPGLQSQNYILPLSMTTLPSDIASPGLF